MTVPDADLVQAIVEDACTAPSLHNTQPWRWVALPDRLELHADRSRHLAATDPTGRDLLISCGAALHTAVVAAAGRGWATRVRRFPEGDDGPLAVLLLSPARPTPAQRELAAAIRRRRSDRRPVSSWPVPDEWSDTLRRVAAEHGVLASPSLDDDQTRLLAALLEAARRVQERHAGYAEELAAWTGSEADDGVPATSLPAEAARFPAGSLTDEHHETAEPAPSWFVLSTSSDDAISWLRTGEALAALWLTCTVAGLSLLPYSQPTDVAVTRRVLQDEVLDDAAFPQLVVRVGWPPISREAVGEVRRRAVQEVLGPEPPTVEG